MKKPILALFLALGVSAQTSFPGSPHLDAAIEEAIAKDQIPGAVCLAAKVEPDGRTSVLHFKAYGNRALVPAREPMTTDTIFDAASLTKVVATSASLMKLFEQGKVRLNDRVTEYLPGFQGGKSDITVRQLLTHFSGMRPDLDLEPEWSGYETGIAKALVDQPVAEPGQRFIYSDINFILLGEIVRVVSGRPLDQFAREEVFLPLGMTETTFNPPAEWRARIAPTEIVKGTLLRGTVHDPTTRYMGGVAGHAGMPCHAAHVPCGGIMDRAAQERALDDFRGSDPRAPFRGRVEGGFRHPQRQEHLFAGELVQRSSRHHAHDLAQQDEVDVGVDEPLSGLGHGLVHERFGDARLIARPLRFKVEIGPHSGEMREQLPDGDVALAALEAWQILGDAVVQPHFALLEELHQRSRSGHHLGERSRVEDRVRGHRLAGGHKRAVAVRLEMQHGSAPVRFHLCRQAHGAGDLVFRNRLLDGGIQMRRTGETGLRGDSKSEKEGENGFLHRSL